MQTINNKVQLIGFLNELPEIKQTPDQGKMVRFSLGTTDTYRNNKGEEVKETQWHRIVGWDEIATVIEQLLDKKRLKKGKQVAVSGKLVHNSYTDKDGNKKLVTEVHINEFLVLGGKLKYQPEPTEQ